MLIQYLHVLNVFNIIFRSLQTVNSLNFYDAINSEWLFGGAEVIDDIPDFLEAWVQTTGYPTIHVGLRQGGVLITQVVIT